MEMAWLDVFSQNQFRVNEYVLEVVFPRSILEVSEAPAPQYLEPSEAFLGRSVAIRFQLVFSQQS